MENFIRENGGVFENNISGLKLARSEISDLCIVGPGH